MEFSIQLMSEKLVFYENKKRIELQGYAFIDKYGGCIIIAYGENRRDFLIEHFNSDSNELKIKYSVRKLNN